ncbi:MAG TPA: hypothetical protein VKS79_12305 [Gemmataceae bacterium]|nr:hypothetical protein [Gemmataceae bacterium]
MKWFRNLYGQLSRPRKHLARRPASFRPQLETFEERMLPSALSVALVSSALHVVQAGSAYQSGDVVLSPSSPPAGPIPVPYPNFA